MIGFHKAAAGDRLNGVESTHSSVIMLGRALSGPTRSSGGALVDAARRTFSAHGIIADRRSLTTGDLSSRHRGIMYQGVTDER